MDVMALVDRSWPILRHLMGLHTEVYRLSGGRIGHRFPGLPSMLLLDHVGAKSGVKRTTPLLYAADGPDTLVIVASKGGHPRHPAWYHNLRAHPETTVQVGRERRPVRARVATPPERDRLWAKALEVYPTYAAYQQRTEREIPLVVLDRR
jgi:deazaflavin-dependent oxidoreductase (nitroreductase family)